MTVCTRCGSESPDGFRFCGNCGAPLEQTAAPRQTRKVVTALFCDVTGSTALGEELDPEVLRGVMNRYFSEIRATIERHGGTVEKFIGDAVMAVFGIPTVREDDALRAVRAAAEIREQLPAVAQEVGVALRFRTGVNTGPVLMGEGENIAIGDAVNVAARLEQAAGPGEIVLGEETLSLVRDAVEVEPLEPLELKGKSEPVAAFRLVHVDPAAAGVARHLDAPLVGRERELRLLSDAWDRAVEEASCHLFTLLGTAGVGKSRLVEELLAAIEQRATVLRGRCLHYGEGITFWPLVEALMPIGEPARQVLEHLDHGGTATAEELFWEVRRLLESLAGEKPVVLFIDDAHWAEPMLLDLLDHVADLSRGAPILLLCTARPEMLEERPSWGGGKLNATTVLLEPLGANEAEALVDQLGNGLGEAARARVVAASEGNPLFLEEMVALARERGTVTVPPTIQALLAARLERLAAEERELLERGAVEGQVFHRLAVRALANERLATQVEPRLAGLVRKELIRPHPATFAGDAFRFRHLLIRDAAYDGLPKAVRAELHQRFAHWLEDSGAELVEFDEIAGWHLEQAAHYRRELGHDVDPSLELSAARHLHAAARRALSRNDVRAVRNLLERALLLATADEVLEAGVAVDLAEQLVEIGEGARAEELIAKAERLPELAGIATLARFELMVHTRPHAAVAMIERALPEVVEAFEQAGDERSLAKAHLAAFHGHWLLSRARAAADLVPLAAEHARRAGDEGTRQRALAWYFSALLHCDEPTESIARQLDELEVEPGPFMAAWLDMVRGEVAGMSGDYDEARRLIEIAIEGLFSLGTPTYAGASFQVLAGIEAAAGDPAAALAALKRSDEMLAAVGEHSFRSTTQAVLADVHEQLGDREAAIAAIEMAEELGAPEDLINFVITHGVRARLALADGDQAEAERWARSAVELAFQTELIREQVGSKLILGRVLAAAGRREEAKSEAQEALAISEHKGYHRGIAEARGILAGV